MTWRSGTVSSPRYRPRQTRCCHHVTTRRRINTAFQHPRRPLPVAVGRVIQRQTWFNGKWCACLWSSAPQRARPAVPPAVLCRHRRLPSPVRRSTCACCIGTWRRGEGERVRAVDHVTGLCRRAWVRRWGGPSPVIAPPSLPRRRKSWGTRIGRDPLRGGNEAMWIRYEHVCRPDLGPFTDETEILCRCGSTRSTVSACVCLLRSGRYHQSFPHRPSPSCPPGWQRVWQLLAVWAWTHHPTWACLSWSCRCPYLCCAGNLVMCL